jgi:ABC-type lipoprotein export system ATPase subunit
METELPIDEKKTALLVIGMAGSGKSTFVNVIKISQYHDTTIYRYL